jgi:hypothetical protein
LQRTFRTKHSGHRRHEALGGGSFGLSPFTDVNERAVFDLPRSTGQDSQATGPAGRAKIGGVYVSLTAAVDTQ